MKNNEKILDSVVSEYSRRKHADSEGMVSCCTCDKVMHWKKMDCGHHIDRKHRATRWHEHNNNAQCPHCNRILAQSTNFEIRQKVYEAYQDFIIREYGMAILGELNSLKTMTLKFMDFEIDELIKTYKDKIKEL